MKGRIMKTLVCGLLGVASLYAQSADMEKKLLAEAQAQVISRVAINRGPVKNAPYSGMSVSEDVQVLADGNRIVNKNATMHYRDSQGRERTENNIGGDGEQTSIVITDPVEGVKYVLLPVNKTGLKTFLPKTVSDEQKVTAKMDLESLVKAKVETVQMPIPSPASKAEAEAILGPGIISFMPSLENTKLEDLGTQVIEGVPAKGTRRTTTIPAGQMGNERDIVTVMERWFSPDLQVLVESTRTDPRSGTNTYKLTNIIRAEPAPSLFQVPADYTLKDITRPSTKDEER
jgi:hypothetical protein